MMLRTGSPGGHTLNNAYWEAQGYKPFKGTWSRRQPA